MNVNPDRLYDLARKGLGLVLVAGGASTLRDSARAVQPTDLAALLAGAVAVVECLGGLWLVFRNPSERTRSWAVPAFTGLWAASLAQLALGRCSCGRFGGTPVSPWYAVVFDLFAVVVLLKERTAEVRPDARPVSPSLLGVAGRVLVAAVFAIAGVWSQPPVVVAGVATFRGRPLGQERLIFRGESVGLEVSTDRDGRFLLPPVRPGPYRVMIAGKPTLPRPTPETSELLARAKTDPEARRELASRGPLRPKARRSARQAPVEPVRPRGDSAILSWDAPPCCGESIPFHFGPADGRRAQGW
jgi:hypothetical protein